MAQKKLSEVSEVSEIQQDQETKDESRKSEINQNDFVELEFTGYAEGKVFDTTSADVAGQEKIFSENMRYKPIVVCVGQGQILAGLDAALLDKNIGKEFEVTLSPEQAFGIRNKELIKILPTSVFREKEINPFPGLVVDFQGLVATIRSVHGGRVTVDFNNPLAGKQITYKVTIKRKLTDMKEKLESLARFYLRVEKFKTEDSKIFVEDKFLEACPPQVVENFVAKVKEILGLEVEVKGGLNEEAKKKDDA